MSDFSLFDKPQGPKKWVRTRELASKNGFWGAKSQPKQTQAKKPKESQVQANVVQTNVAIRAETKPDIEHTNDSWDDSWDD